MWNGVTPGTEGLFQNFTKSLWEAGGRLVSVDRERRSDSADFIVDARFGAATLTLAVDVKLVPPRSRVDVRRLRDAVPGKVNVLLAPFLSPPVRDELTQAGWSYWDAAGNMRIRSSEPAVWIDRVGAARNPDPSNDAGAQRLRSLKGKAASEVVVSLLGAGTAASVREVARETGTGVGTASRVIDLLRSEELLTVTATAVEVPDRVALARRWAQDYGFETTFKPTRYLSLLGEEIAVDRLQRSDLRYATTGSRAAAVEFERSGRVSPLPATGVWLYTDDVQSVERAMDLAPDRRGSILVARCDFLDKKREGAQDTRPKIARSWRIVGDLLAAGGRLAAVGEELAALHAAGTATR